MLGKHTDYAGGRSLLCATDLGIAFVAQPRNDARVTIRDERSGELDAFEISGDLETTTGDWTNYPRTVARRLCSNFGSLRGADIVFESSLPLAAGMSSSSALIVGFSTVLMRLNELESSSAYRSNISSVEERAGYLGTVENGQTFGSLEGAAGVGTFGGSEDHTAILCCSPGALKQYAFCPVVHERSVAFPDSLCFVIGSSGVIAEKTGAALDLYNRASRLAGAAARVIGAEAGTEVPHLAAAVRGASGERRDEIRSLLGVSDAEGFTGQDFVDRYDQFVNESETIIPAATSALDNSDLERFGALICESQQCGWQLLKNQVEETVWLADEAVRQGALAGSAFGAGFGGSVYALVGADSVTSFVDRWRTGYVDRFPARSHASDFLITRPGPATFELSP